MNITAVCTLSKRPRRPTAWPTCHARRRSSRLESQRNVVREKTKRLKQFPVFKTGDEAEQFVDTADLSEYDFSQFKPVRFEFEKKAAQLNMRVPQPLLDAVKDRARARGIPYTRYIRELIEHDLSRVKS
jgi:predicted DNA binding CopG/RHH family protein